MLEKSMFFETPILFLFFNRPESTLRVFDQIKKVKPKIIYLASDGPRTRVNNENEIVVKLREDVLKKIDWACEVKTLYREENLGAGEAVGGAIDWFFEEEEKGIIIEDDCLPNLSFFNFCKENLDYYEEDKRIMAITGDNFYPKSLTDNSYFFSKYFHMWGWATWRRSWLEHRSFLNKFEEIVLRPNLSSLSLSNKYANKRIIENAINAYRKKRVDAWDYQFILSGFLSNSLTVTPNVNLIKNLGFDENATHTKKKNSLMTINHKEIYFPLKHPKHKIPEIRYDNYLYQNVFQWRPYWKRAFDFNYLRMLYNRFIR